jgi:hypothetical protein
MVASWLLVLPVRAAEEKVPLKKVPRAVLKAVKDRFPGAKLKGAGKEKEDDKVVYEINIEYKGFRIDVTVTPEGKIATIEKQIKYKDLPRAVSEAVEEKYPRATIKKTEEVTKGDKITYEVLLVTQKKKTVEVVLDPKGKVVKTEVKKEKKEE